MKRWSAPDWCMFILTLTIPVAMLGTMLIRLITGQPISDKAAEIVNNMLNIIGGGVLTILGGKIVSNKKEAESKNNPPES